MHVSSASVLASVLASIGISSTTLPRTASRRLSQRHAPSTITFRWYIEWTLPGGS
jgi:hypothetical protein